MLLTFKTKKIANRKISKIYFIYGDKSELNGIVN